MFISSNEQEIPKEDCPLVWLDKDMIYESDKISVADISPPIKHPFKLDVLDDLVQMCENICKHNFIPTVLVLEGTVLSF